MVSSLLGGSDGHGIPVWFSSSPSSSAPMTYPTSTRHASPSGRVLGARADERLAARVSSSDTNGKERKVTNTRRSSLDSDRSRCHECRGRAATPPVRRTRQAGRGAGATVPELLERGPDLRELLIRPCRWGPSSVSLRDAVLVCPACDAPTRPGTRMIAERPLQRVPRRARCGRCALRRRGPEP